MEFIGKFVKLGTMTEGNSPRGPWKKQDVIFETTENFPKTICVVCWNDRVNEAATFYAGQIVTVHISPESREFNGKWYTDIRAVKFDQQQAAQPKQQQPQQRPPLPPVNEEYLNGGDAPSDDLPF